RRQRVGNGVADLRPRIEAARGLERDLVGRIFDVLDHQHVAGQPQLTLLGVNLRVDVGFRAVAGARGFGDRVFHRSNHNAAVDRLFARDGIRDLQEFQLVGADSGHWFSLLRGDFGELTGWRGVAAWSGPVSGFPFSGRDSWAMGP